MKVSQLLEGDDWDNNSKYSENYAFKKQLDACHQFQLEIRKLNQKYPGREFEDWLESEWLEALPIIDNARLMDFQFHFTQEFPSIERLWNVVVHTKTLYEAMGGDYNREG